MLGSSQRRVGCVLGDHGADRDPSVRPAQQPGSPSAGDPFLRQADELSAVEQLEGRVHQPREGRRRKPKQKLSLRGHYIIDTIRMSRVLYISISQVRQVEQLLTMITPLLVDNAAAATDSAAAAVSASVAQAKFKEEQYLVARVPHLVRCEDTDVALQVFIQLRTAFARGGASRMQYSFPPLVFAALQLARRVFKREKQAKPYHLFGLNHFIFRKSIM